MMDMSIYTEKTTDEIKDELGWWDHGESKDFGQLVAVCMVLCDRIAALENKQTK